jgi:hypothetical protein
MNRGFYPVKRDEAIDLTRRGPHQHIEIFMIASVLGDFLGLQLPE